MNISGKFSIEKIVKELSKLEPEEFIGVCRILEIDLMDGDKPKGFSDIWSDMCDKLSTLGRVQRKNLMKLLRAANEDR